MFLLACLLAASSTATLVSLRVKKKNIEDHTHIQVDKRVIRTDCAVLTIYHYPQAQFCWICLQPLGDLFCQFLDGGCPTNLDGDRFSFLVWALLVPHREIESLMSKELVLGDDLHVEV